MVNYSDNEDVRKNFNFTNVTVLPNTYVSLNGTYEFSYNFLIKKTDLTKIDQDNDQEDAFKIIMYEKSG